MGRWHRFAPRRSLHRWLDILVDAEEILRVVAVLDLHEAIVALPEGRANPEQSPAKNPERKEGEPRKGKHRKATPES